MSKVQILMHIFKQIPDTITWRSTSVIRKVFIVNGNSMCNCYDYLDEFLIIKFLRCQVS